MKEHGEDRRDPRADDDSGQPHESLIHLRRETVETGVEAIEAQLETV